MPFHAKENSKTNIIEAILADANKNPVIFNDLANLTNKIIGGNFLHMGSSINHVIKILGIFTPSPFWSLLLSKTYVIKW